MQQGEHLEAVINRGGDMISYKMNNRLCGKMYLHKKSFWVGTGLNTKDPDDWGLWTKVESDTDWDSRKVRVLRLVKTLYIKNGGA
jgi:hypothetical protein